MPVYAVEVTFGDDADLRERIRPEHRRYIERLVEEGTVWLTGPWEDGSGGMLIFDVPDRAALDRILAGDPYTPAGVVNDRRIRAWNPPLGSLLPTTTNSLRPLATALLERADDMDVDGWVKYLAEDVDFRLANTEPIKGREAVREAIGQFFAQIKGIRHTTVSDWEIDDTVVQHVQVTYTRQDGEDVTVPAATILRFRNGEIGEYHVYVDMAPLWEA